MRGLLRRLNAWWLPIAEAISAFLGRIVLTLFYIVIALPFGLMARLFVDPLGLRRKGSSWTAIRDREQTVEEGRRQF